MEGSLVFISPGKWFEVEDFGKNFQPKGYALMFHPDFIHGTSLWTAYTGLYFFLVIKSNEALHLSARERKIVLDCFSND
jgi:hypothetical protein